MILHEELEIRVNNIKRLMGENNLDGLLLTHPKDIQYFSGLETTFWESPTRGFFMVIPREKEPFAIVPSLVSEAFSKLSIMGNVYSWQSEDPCLNDVKYVAELLDNLPKTYARIGMPLGAETSVRLSYYDFQELLGALKSEVVDASKLVWSLRLIKSSSEIFCIREACKIASSAYDNLATQIAPGMSERELAAIMQQEMLKKGMSDIPFMAAAFGENSYRDIVSSPSDECLTERGIFFLDTGGRYQGYFCDFDRNFALGSVDDAVKKAYEILWRATEAGIASIREGVLLFDVWREMVKIVDDFTGKATLSGRFGHGFGLALTEPPSFCIADKTTKIENGMTLTIEPSMQIPEFGTWMVHEENIAIIDGEPSLLTKRAPSELPVVW